MGQELSEELQQLISERIETVVKDRFYQLGVKVDSIQKCVDILSGDLEEDRRNLSQMRIDTTTLTQQVKELQDSINRMGRNISTKVGEKAEAAVENAAQVVAAQVEPVMAKAVQKIKNGVPLNKRPWYKFW